MAKTLEEILGWEPRTAGVKDPAGGVPTDVLPPGFFTGTRPVRGYKSSYLRREDTRKTATIVGYDSPATPAGKGDTAEVPVILVHSFEFQQHGAILLANLLTDNDAVQKMAEEELNYQTALLKQRQDNLRIASAMSMLTLGYLYFNGQNLLPSSVGATLTVDYSATTGNTYIGAWDTTGTDIGAQMMNIRTAVRKDNGLKITECLYGANIFGYLAANDTIKNLTAGTPGWAASMAQGMIPQGLLGLNWWPASDTWFEDQDGTNQDFFDADSISLFPSPSSAWYELQEGSYPVPTNLGNVAGTATAALADFVEVYGMFAYATMTNNPVGVQQFVGDTFLPVAKTPGAINIVADVTTAVS